MNSFDMGGRVYLRDVFSDVLRNRAAAECTPAARASFNRDSPEGCVVVVCALVFCVLVFSGVLSKAGLMGWSWGSVGTLTLRLLDASTSSSPGLAGAATSDTFFRLPLFCAAVAASLAVIA